ncbi:MAG: phosphatase PAP2 family protein [Thermoanaerobacterales bacterium]|nr:phosphatase PAP2 family protein [Thermoanaerobacterales bacterium]
MWSVLRATDNRVFWFCHKGLRCRLLDRLLPLLTHLGSAGATIAVTLATLFAGLLSGREAVWRAGISVAIALAASHLVVHVVKHRVNRPRPRFVLHGTRFFDVPTCPYSFPSGHTNAAFVVAMAIYPHLPLIGLPLLILAAVIGFSRVYLGVHYASDVAGGGLIGVTFGLLAGWVGW